MWDRDSHGLFDYESKGIVNKTIKATGCSKNNIFYKQMIFFHFSNVISYSLRSNSLDNLEYPHLAKSRPSLRPFNSGLQVRSVLAFPLQESAG